MTAERWNPPRMLPRLRLIRTAPILVYTYGRTMPADYIEHWTPTRNVSHPQVCATCWEPIKPGAALKRFTRGRRTAAATGAGGDVTRAYFEHNLGLWRCVPCQAEGSMTT